MPTQQFDQFSGLRSAISDTRAAGAQFTGATGRFVRDTNSLTTERNDLGSGLAAQTARLLSGPSGGTSFSSTLSANTRVAKARQGIQNRGEKAIKEQQLRDRISIAKTGLRKRKRGLSALTDAASIREGVDLANADADDRIGISNADLFGGVAGGFAGLLREKFRKPVGEG